MPNWAGTSEAQEKYSAELGAGLLRRVGYSAGDGVSATQRKGPTELKFRPLKRESCLAGAGILRS